MLSESINETPCQGQRQQLGPLSSKFIFGYNEAACRDSACRPLCLPGCCILQTSAALTCPAIIAEYPCSPKRARLSALTYKLTLSCKEKSHVLMLMIKHFCHTEGFRASAEQPSVNRHLVRRCFIYCGALSDISDDEIRAFKPTCFMDREMEDPKHVQCLSSLCPLVSSSPG